VALAYFYFDFNNAQKQHVNELLCFIITQLFNLRSDAAEKVQNMYRSCQDEQQHPLMNFLQKCLEKILYRSGDTFLVIDALNKCTQQEKLLDLIKKICS